MTKKALIDRIGPAGCLSMFVLAMGGFVFWTCSTQGEVRDAGVALATHLRQNDDQRAYALLSRHQQSVLSFEDFRRQVDRAPFRQFDDVGFGNVVTWGDALGADEQACSLGSITTDRGEWGFEIHAVSQDDGWRIEAFAVEPPPASSAHLVEACEGPR